MTISLIILLYILVYGYFYEGAIEIYKTKMNIFTKVFVLALYPFAMILIITTVKL